MKFLFNYGWAMYLGAISCAVGVPFPSWEYIAINFPTILLVMISKKKGRDK
jgi:hypothetical protein